MKIAILGAEYTGKTQLAQALPLALASRVADTDPKNFLITDAPALMAATDRDVLFSDTSLYPAALEQHRSYDLTFVMGLDLPWTPDGVNRNRPPSQTRVDTRLREVLQTEQLDFTVIYGAGSDRTDCALQTILHHMKKPPSSTAKPSAWHWSCENCSDSDCEHRLFSGLILTDSMRV